MAARVYLANERTAINLLLRDKRSRVVFITLFPFITLLYIFLLPSLPSGMIYLAALGFLTPIQLIFALVFGGLMSTVIALNVLSFRLNRRQKVGATIGSVLASLVNGLCCTPLIPSLFALAGASSLQIFEYSPKIQAFFEFNYIYFYLLSALLLLISIHYLSRNVCCCTVDMTNGRIRSK